jgi:hypothetical protein
LTSIETQCRCGAVALKISDEPAVQLYCHCDDCQTAHSAAYTMSAIYPAASVQVVNGEAVALVVKSTRRMRCGACGTHLFSELTRVGMRSVNAYLLPAGVFKPQFHVQCQHAALPVVDDLPHYKGFPAAFGGREEFVAW